MNSDALISFAGSCAAVLDALWQSFVSWLVSLCCVLFANSPAGVAAPDFGVAPEADPLAVFFRPVLSAGRATTPLTR